MKKLVLVGLVLALGGGSVGASVAQDQSGVPITNADRLKIDRLLKFAAGLGALNRNDGKAAFILWSPLAEDGVTNAQVGLGFLYAQGQGVPQDYTAAASWWRKAADQGDADAQSSLGNLYERGQGVPQDYAAAVIWYRKAADNGKAEAQKKLGLLYENGQGVPQDYVAALSWYRKAADQGNTQSQFLLGAQYAKGQIVKQDYLQAHKWLNLSAAGEAGSELGKIAVTVRDEVAKLMTPAQIAEAQRLASEWRKK